MSWLEVGASCQHGALLGQQHAATRSPGGVSRARVARRSVGWEALDRPVAL